MCEFKVTVSDGGQSSVVATDIVYAELVDGKIILKDILGVSLVVESAIISHVNVNSQQMKLLSLPIINNFIKFIEHYNKCISEREYNSDLEKIWNQFKIDGDTLVEDLKGV